jgi:hypothetical protein
MSCGEVFFYFLLVRLFCYCGIVDSFIWAVMVCLTQKLRTTDCVPIRRQHDSDALGHICGEAEFFF